MSTPHTPQEEPIPAEFCKWVDDFIKTEFAGNESVIQRTAIAAYRHLSPRIKQLEADLSKIKEVADQKSKEADAEKRHASIDRDEARGQIEWLDRDNERLRAALRDIASGKVLPQLIAQQALATPIDPQPIDTYKAIPSADILAADGIHPDPKFLDQPI